MANICTFEMKVKGKKEEAYSFVKHLECYSINVSEKTIDTEVLLYVKGECPWNVTRCMVQVDENETLRAISEKHNLEIEVFGYDLSDPEWIEHFYYKNGERIKEFNFLNYFYITEYEDGEIDADISMYILHEDAGVYALKPEYQEPFEWNKKKKQMKFEFEMNKIYDLKEDEETIEKDTKKPKTNSKKTVKRETKEEKEAREIREFRLESLKMMGVPIDENGMAIKETDGTMFLYDYFGNESKITIPDGITAIFYKGLRRLKTVEEIIFTASVKTIDDGCFVSCENLKTVHFTDKTTEIGEYVFYKCPNLTIYAPAGSYAEAFAKKNNISFVAEGVAEDEYKYEANALDENEAEESISSDKMYSYIKVEDGICITQFLNPNEIDGKSVYKLEKSPFGGKRRIRINTELVIPSNIDGNPVVELGEGMFQFLSVGFDSITVSEGIKRISVSALFGNIGIVKLHLPSTVEYIDPLVFAKSNGEFKDLYIQRLKTIFVKKGSYAHSFITQYKFEEDFVHEIPEVVVVE